MPSDLIRGWIPVRVKKTRQNNKIEPRFGSNRNRKGSSNRKVARFRRPAHAKGRFNPQTKTPPLTAGSSRGGGSRTRLPDKLVIRPESALRPRAARAAHSRGPTRFR